MSKYQATITREQPLRTNPFPGLRTYHSDEADRFFGRSHQVRELQMRLRRNRFLAVVGTSGSGKSSLVRAGLLPRLVGDPGTHWHTVITTPGDEPIVRLARRIAYSSLHASSPVDAAERVVMIEASLRRGSLGLVEAVRQSGKAGRVIFVIDQFEELFRVRGTAEEEAAGYVRLLLEAASQAAQPICVVLTLRADYLGDCSRFATLPEALNGGQYLVPRLTRENRREVIAGPVELGGATVAPRLMHRLLNDVGDNPDQLPILQHAMMRTWEHWRRREAPDLPVDLEDYEAIGTMAHALMKHAEETFGALGSETGARLAERLFKRLTEKGADNRKTRHPSRFGDVCAAAGCTVKEMRKVVDHFREPDCSFVLPGLEEPLDDETLLDISHESLIRVWGRLREWVDREAEDGAAYIELANRAEGYLGPSKTEDVLTGQTLRHFEEWRRRVEPNVAWATRYSGDFAHAVDYLDLSAREHQRRESAQQAAAAREARLNRLLTRASWVLLLLAVVAAGFAGYAWKQRAEAEAATDLAKREQERAMHSANVATSRQLAMASEDAVFSDAELGVLLALHAVDKSYPEHVIEATIALNRAMQVLKHRTLITRFEVGVADAAFDPGGERVVAVSRNGVVDAIERSAPGGRARVCAGDAELGEYGCSFLVTAVDISADLGTAALGDNDGNIAVLRPGSGAPAVALVEAHEGPVSALAVDAAGARLVSASRHGRILFDRIEPGGLHRVADLVGHPGPVTAFALDASGTWLLAGDSNGVTRLWNLDRCEAGAGQRSVDCEAEIVLEGHGAAVTSAVFGPGSVPLIATGDADGNVRIWDTMAPPVPKVTVDGLDSAITVLVFGADEASPMLAIGTREGQVGLWKADGGANVDFMVDSGLFSRGGASLLAHTVGITALAFDAEGTQLASGSSGARIKIWSVASGKRQATLQARGGWVTSLSFADPGRQLLSADDAGRVIVWRTPQRDAAADDDGWKRDVLVAMLDDGVRLVAAIAGGDLALLRTNAAGEIRRQQIVGQERVKQIAFRPDPARIVTLGDDGLEREYILDRRVLIDAAARRVSRELTPAECKRYLYGRDCHLQAQWRASR